MIQFDSVDLSFNGKQLFRKLSFEVKKGTKIAILGKSGTGKSSLFSLILGFLRPDAGKVSFDGACVDNKNAWEVRQRISFIDQDVSVRGGIVSDWFTFVSGFKANASLDFGLDRVKDLFAFFELSIDLLHKDVSALSGGERQRIAIVVSILLGRNTFLLDEVTSTLDRHLKEKVAHFFIRDKDWTVVAISHDDIWLNHPDVKVFDLEAEKWK